LASYEPDVRTPAEKTYTPMAEKRERKRQTVGGKGLKPNADEATSQDKGPLHTSCDPNNWGMRRHEPAGASGQPDYPVARAYVEAVKPALMGIDWKRGGWPLEKGDHKFLNDLFQAQLPKALSQGAFGLPKDAMPTVLIPNDQEAKDLKLADFGNPDLKGIMRPKDWLLVGYKGGVISIITEAKDGEDITNAVRDFASTMYHEARHAQQFFWTAALVQQHAGDYAHLPHIQQVWDDFMPKKYLQVAARTPLPDEPSARVGLHRMCIAMYYWLLCHYDSQNKLQPNKPGYMADILPTEIPLARKAAYELLQDVGLGGKPIDVDQMAKGAAGSFGYRMRPWEEDSFVCDEVVKQLWSGNAGAGLPRPGFCTRVFDIASGSVQGSTGGDPHAH
ncbi:hypothetical protein ACSFBL_35260, partial [Variovorax sp. GT1P44]